MSLIICFTFELNLRIMKSFGHEKKKRKLVVLPFTSNHAAADYGVKERGWIILASSQH